MVAPFKDRAAARLPLDVEDWSRRFPLLRRLFEALHREPSTQYPYGVVRCPKWAVNNVAIIGDAAHGLPPTLGQGGGLTLMNRSEEHTSELQSLMRISYAVFCLKKKNNKH